MATEIKNAVKDAVKAVKAVTFAPVSVAGTGTKGKGTKRNKAAREAFATSLFAKGLTFLGVLGQAMADVLIEGGTVTMPNGKQVTTEHIACPFCGSYNGKQKTDAERLALTSVFFSGAKDAKEPTAQYHFVSAGSSESCLAKYIKPSQIGKGEELKAAYSKLW